MDRVAVVTGGASGIGRAVCRHLAAQGHPVAVLDLDLDAAQAVAEEIRAERGHTVAVRVDVTDRVSVDEALAQVRHELGPTGILVTSAAISEFARFEEITLDDWSRLIAVNLTGTFHCVQATIPDMLAAGWGRVVTIASDAGHSGSPRQTHYSASKGGVIAFTKALALEYARKGITVNSVAPFAVDTPRLRAAQEDGDLPEEAIVTRMIPAGRIGTPDDIAATCTFLCSEGAGYITGQLIAPNGGAVT